MDNPLNLKEMYGNYYKIVLDEASYEPGGKKNPWYFIVDCKYGFIYPHSAKLLGYYCVGTKIRSKLHHDYPEIEVRQWSEDGECIFLFPPERFKLIAEYAKPRRKRKLSESHKKKLIISGTDTRFFEKNTALRSV